MSSAAAFRWLACVGLAATATVAGSGPWSDLPDAVERLQRQARDLEAEAVLREAEESVLREARAGRLAAVLDLTSAYRELVIPLADGELRAELLARRVAEVLLEAGDRQVASDPSGAAARWIVAARLADDDRALERLRRTVLPPPEAEAGDAWVSPVDGAELVHYPSRLYRIGCTVNDRLCEPDEVYFRYVEVGSVWVERTEVTNRRYRRCVEAGACTPPVDPERYELPGSDDEPVVGVTWNQAVRYARWSGRRLPSEAEWERFARGEDDRSRFPWGNQRRPGLAQVWNEQPEAGEVRRLAPVGSHPATGLGLFDIAGNAWEWCEDRYQPGLKQIPSDGGAAVDDGWGRVIRGGSWRRTLELARVSSRDWQEEGYSADDLGFRTVLGPTRSAPSEHVLSAAESAFPTGLERGRGIALARLSDEDRRYLVRRALTWLMLEGRLDEALAQAVAIVGQGVADRLAMDVIVRFEQRLLDDAGDGNGDRVAESLGPYLELLAREPELGRRRSDFSGPLLRLLRARGQEAANAGEPDRAAGLYRAARLLAPADPLLARSLESVRPSPGTVRTSPRDGREMIWVPSGDFRFGASAADDLANLDEYPAVDVRVDAFWLDRREVSNDDYRRCVADGDCSPPHDRVMFDDPNLGAYPVLWVDWYQARDYAAWAGKRLPTEAEWERAARAGGMARFPWGIVWEGRYANSLGTDPPDRWGGTAPVGSLAPDAWGAFDLIGNAAEWVADRYHPDLWGAPRDGRAWNQLIGGPVEPRRVIRGGSYDDPPTRLRVSHRQRRDPADWHRTVGFRCVADPDAQ